MLTKLQFQTLFGFKPTNTYKSAKTVKKTVKNPVKNPVKKTVKNPVKNAAKKVAKKAAKIVKKSNKVGTRMIKGVKRTVYKGKNGGKFYKKSNGRKVYFGPAMAIAKTLGVKGAVKVMSAKAIEGAGYTLGYQAANVGVSMLKKAIKKKKSTKMGRKKMVAGKKRTVYKTATGAKYYKSAKGNKVYFGKPKVVQKFGKKRKSRRNTRFGNHGYAGLNSMMGPSPAMFASSIPSGL